MYVEDLTCILRQKNLSDMRHIIFKIASHVRKGLKSVPEKQFQVQNEGLFTVICTAVPDRAIQYSANEALVCGVPSDRSLSHIIPYWHSKMAEVCDL